MKTHLIEYPDKGYFLTIGKNAPWQGFHIRIPKVIFILLLKLKTS